MFDNFLTMFVSKRQTEQEEPEIGQLREWLPKLSGESRAYIRGASQALLYAQEGFDFSRMKTKNARTTKEK
jgi:hypothetical protein